jgi:hypothetical protein
MRKGNRKKYLDYLKLYRQSNKKKIAEQKHNWFVLNKNTKVKESNIKNHDKIIQRDRNRYNRDRKNNLEYKQKRHKQYLKYKDKIIKRIKLYRIKNKNKLRNSLTAYIRNRKKTDINFKILLLLRRRILDALHNNCKSNNTIILLGCSIDFLKQHLQSTAIQNGYLDFNINNYDSKQFHIDHIIPCSTFNLSCSYHQKLCFNWSNLQILDANKNILKFQQDNLLYRKCA